MIAKRIGETIVAGDITKIDVKRLIVHLTTDALIVVVWVMDSSIAGKGAGIALETVAAVEVAAVVTITMRIITNPHHHRTSTRANSFALLNYSTVLKGSSFLKKALTVVCTLLIIVGLVFILQLLLLS